MCPIPVSGTIMGSSIIQTVSIALGACFFGVLIGWSIQALIGKQRVGGLSNEDGNRLAEITAQRTKLANAYSRSKSTIERLEAKNTKRKVALKSAIEKAKLLAQSVRTLRDERENTKIKISTVQNAMNSLRQQTTALQSEFDKTREFYKRELLKSVKKRKELEEDAREARAEQESFARLVESSVLEHGSPENMIAAAQLRLGQIEVLERNVNKLEAENAQLRQDAVQARQQFDARERDLKELEELKLHNRQLVQCVEALENSRQAYETDAERYREQADQSEKESDTLRLKLEDLEKNFADIEKQQNSALEDARNATVIPILRKQQ